MDGDREVLLTKLWLVGAIVGLLSLYWSWTEINYLLRGSTAAIVVDDVDEVLEWRGRRGREVRSRRVTYTLPDPVTGRREEWFNASQDSPIAKGTPLTIEYIPGSPGWARLDGTGRTWPLFVTAGGAVALGAWLFMLSREVNQYAAR